jgi:hypothetical protein
MKSYFFSLAQPFLINLSIDAFEDTRSSNFSNDIR